MRNVWERQEVTRRFGPTGLLIADGVGCAVAAYAVLSSECIAGSVDPTLRSRQLIGAALGATSALLLSGSVRCRNRDLALAAVANAGWVGACLVALSRRPSRLGGALIAATAVLDGGAAVVQWRLRSNVDAVEFRFNV